MKKICLTLIPTIAFTTNCLFVTSCGNASIDPTKPIHVTGGKITGITSPLKNNIALYKGIPYAAAPVGNYRFKAPQNVVPWQGIKACDKWGYSAIQAEQHPFQCWSKEFIIEDTGYSEDCLTLNVFTKKDNIKNKPVIVYVHGGGFTSGGSSCDVYDGSEMADLGCVFVSINYRVGALGFLATTSLKNEEGVGNFGTLDVIKALEWVRDNISHFNGDKNNVTLMGQSAGSGMIQYVLASEKSKGLVHKALCESYNAYNPDSKHKDITLDNAIEAGDAKFSGYSLDQLRQLSTDQIMSLSTGITFRPVVNTSVIAKTYDETIESGSLTDVVFMTGMVDRDTDLFPQIGKPTDWTDAQEKVSQYLNSDSTKISTFTSLYNFSESNYLKSIQQFNIDYLMFHINEHALARKAKEPNTFTYLFNYVMPGPEASTWGAFHTSDVPYFLGHLSKERNQYWTQKDTQLAKYLSHCLYNFVSKGNPSYDTISWKEDTQGEFMTIGDEFRMSKLSDNINQFISGLEGSVQLIV